MINISSVTSQVKHNCNISDAKHWGNYSPCGLLIRARDLYKIENGLKPWEEISHKIIGAWIDEREQLWQEIEEQNFQHINVNGKQYDPFDINGINDHLAKHKLFYGAGYGNMMKPVFMLANLSSYSVKGKFRIHTVNREIARDLSTSPAMIREHTIIAREETARMYLWGKFEEMRARKCAGSLHHAFAEYGLSRDSDRAVVEKMFPDIVREELDAYIYHEIGEASQRRILGKWWKELLMKIPYSRAEIFIRALKDVMSDSCSSGMLSYIIKNRKTASLSFYVSLLSGYRKVIFPDIITAYHEFRATTDWNIIEKARSEGYEKAGEIVRKLKGFYDKGDISPEAIEKELIP